MQEPLQWKDPIHVARKMQSGRKQCEEHGYDLETITSIFHNGKTEFTMLEKCKQE